MKISVFIFAIFLVSFVSAECNSTQIDINTASAEELDFIKWVGNATAQLIINYRNNNLFDSVDELIEIDGIGPTRLEDIKSQGLACVDESTIPEPESSGNSSQTFEENSSDIPQQNNESGKKITATANSVSEGNEVDNINEPEISEVIKLNAASQEDIKSEKSFLGSGNLAIVGLGVFSVIIGTLLLLKFKTKKNELV